MKKIFSLLSLFICAAAMLAVNITLPVDPAGWEANSRSRSLAPLLDPGAPQLSYYPVRVLIPFGERVEEVKVSLSGMQMLRGNLLLNHIPQQQPISLPTADLTVKDPQIWETDALFPEADHLYLGTQFYRGYQIAVINVYPYKYNPVRQELYACDSFRIEIETVRDDALARYQANFYSPALGVRGLQDFALNTEAAATYSLAPLYRDHAPHSRLIDLSNPKRMIVITDATRAPWFTDYVQWRGNSGISTGIFLTSDIYASYAGADNAAKVRAFISDAYQTWADTSTPLEYVILGGDDEIVPERGCYGQVGNTVDQRMPTDIYFSNLDGDWNANGNNLYGEPLDNVDFLPEVHIGRFTAETYQEFDNIFRKTQYYVNNSTFSNNISIMFGENLNWNPLTWGGDYKDDVANHIPETYDLRTMYQRDGTYNDTAVWHAINNGANVMNHMGHANETYLMGQGNNTIEQLQNSEYGFLYTQGCYPAAFDQRTSGDGESIAEHMITAQGGLFAFIGNTRYGWYAPGSINGASQFFDREYFIGLFETLNTRLGEALTYSRLQNLNAAMSYDVMRWCYYEVVLLGDPSIEVKYPDPSLPLLSLHSYTISDEAGDNDGTINPGEIIRIYPVVKNHQDWAPAYNVSVRLEGIPAGFDLLGPCISIPQLEPGQTSDPSLYIGIQLPNTVGYGIYYLKLVMESLHPVTQLSTGLRQFELSFEITLMDSRFPWDCAVGSKSAPIVYDFDGDGSLDIHYLDVNGTSYLIDSMGELYDDFSAPDGFNIMRSSALGDVNGNGQADIVFASRNGYVHAVSASGTLVYNYNGGSSFLFTPVIADIDGDGVNEVIAHSQDGNLHVIKANGSSAPGFPVNLGSPFYTEIATADLDGDGAWEIIAGTQNGMLHVIKAGGIYHSGFPVQTGGLVSGAPTVLGNNRIALGTNNQMLLFAPDGTQIASRPIIAAMATSPVLADMNRDGNLDIIFVTINGWLYVVDQAGNDLPGFPLSVGVNFTCPPLIANLDDDMCLEILLSSYMNSVFAYNHDGSGLAGFPFITSYNGSTPATLCDFDGDGTLSLVSGYSTGVLMLNLRRPVTNKMPWITYRGSLSRQGSYAATGYVSSDDALAPAYQDLLLQNYPNPFNPSTTIRFQTASAGKVRLGIYNLKGQLVKLLQDGTLAPGDHQLVWNGTDDKGRAVGSGIYFYRLDTNGKSFSRRMLLLK